MAAGAPAAHISAPEMTQDRKSTRLNSSHTEIYTLSLHDALPICRDGVIEIEGRGRIGVLEIHGGGSTGRAHQRAGDDARSEEHTSELQSHRDLHSFPTRRSSDLPRRSN